MLLIAGPSRRPNDVGISLHARSGCHAAADGVAALAVAARCPPSVAARVRSAIYHSGRYDCRVSPAAAFMMAASDKRLAPLAASVQITD